MIRVKGLRKKLPNGKELLKGVDFTVESGEFVGILGPSGAGKSLTMRCIVGLMKPTEGSVEFEYTGQGGAIRTVDTCSLSGEKLRRARRQMGVIFQGANLVKRLTALENVMLGRLGFISPIRSWLYGFTDKEAEEAYEALKEVKMQDYAGRRVGNLSGGEQQRVAIARAMFQSPSVYLADEPVSSLDPKNARKVMKLLKPLSETKPVIGVFHQPQLTAKYCTRVIAIKDGTVVYDGAPELSQEDLAMIYESEMGEIVGEGEHDLAGSAATPASPLIALSTQAKGAAGC